MFEISSIFLQLVWQRHHHRELSRKDNETLKKTQQICFCQRKYFLKYLSF